MRGRMCILLSLVNHLNLPLALRFHLPLAFKFEMQFTSDWVDLPTSTTCPWERRSQSTKSRTHRARSSKAGATSSTHSKHHKIHDYSLTPSNWRQLDSYKSRNNSLIHTSNLNTSMGFDAWGLIELNHFHTYHSTISNRQAISSIVFSVSRRF